MWGFVKKFFNYPIIDWNECQPEYLEDGTEIGVWVDVFNFSILNIILIIAIYLFAKIFIKYIKRYFKAWHLTDRQLKIEGKEIAVWGLTKQLIYLLTFYACFLSLKINNPQLDLGNILGYEFVRLGDFHIAFYHLFLTVAIFFLARITVNFLKVVLLKAVQKNGRIDSGTQYIYVQLAKYFIYTVAIIIFLRSLGMNLDLFLTATTFLLVGVGLGLQNIFRDYFSGILLLLEGTIKVGDVLEIEATNNSENFIAKVVQINLRTSKVETRDEKVLVIPNSKLTQESIINWNAGTKLTRFSIPITFRYGVDTDLVKQILLDCATNHPDVATEEDPLVRLLKFGPSGLEMDLIFWAKQNLYIEILKSDIRFAIDKELRKQNITIPYPQTDIHVRESPTGRDDSVSNQGFDPTKPTMN